MTKYDLLSLDDATGLSQEQVVRDYRDFVSPSIGTYMRILGMDTVRIARAEGMYMYTDDGRKILDFSGGMCVLNHGHNHPRIVAARRKLDEAQTLNVCKAFISPYQSALARNLAQILPGDLQYTFFCNSGAEANEGALKIATLFAGRSRDKILYTDMGYHGKTFGTMSVSGPASEPHRELFKTIDGCIEVPWGSVEAVREEIARQRTWRGNRIGVMILEAIKGDIALRPPDGYLTALAKLLRDNGIVLILDEIFTGFARTGRWFGFEHYDVVPDVVTYAKSLGGGKATIAGFTTRKDIFEKTFGSMSGASIHTSTFGGIGDECATAIEALNVINDEGLVEAAEKKGAYMLQRMQDLARRYPQYIKDARAIGLLGTFELRRSSELFKLSPLQSLVPIDSVLEGLLTGVITTELFSRHNVLHYVGGRMDVLLVNPALIVTEAEIDRFMDALDQVLSSNLIKLGTAMASNLVPLAKNWSR